MDKLQTLIDDYNQLTSGSFSSLPLKKAYPVSFNCLASDMITQDELAAIVDNMPAAEGWAQFTDRNLLLPTDKSTAGMLLEAEYILDAKHYRIRYINNNCWSMQTFSVDKTDEQTCYLALDASQLIDGLNQARFVYQNIWQITEDKGLQPLTYILKAVTQGESA